MIQLRSIVKAADNTGAQRLSVIQVHGKGNKKIGNLGDILTCVVKSAQPQGTVKTHELVKAVLVRAKKEQKRPDGSSIRFDDNAVVIIDNIHIIAFLIVPKVRAIFTSSILIIVL